MLSGNSLRQTVYIHRASVHQAAKLEAALLRVAGVTAGLAESNGSLPPGLWLTSPAGWLPRTGISSGNLRSVIEYRLPFLLCQKNVLCWFWTVEFNLWKSAGVAVTSSGQLPCQYIFHIAAEYGIEVGIKACLAEAHRRQLSSITFPLLGTGMHCWAAKYSV